MNDFLASSRIVSNCRLLLDLVSQFPMRNPSYEPSAETDIVKLMNQIKSRYKVLCTQVGARPSLRAGGHSSSQHNDMADSPSRKKDSVWKMDVADKSVDYSF